MRATCKETLFRRIPVVGSSGVDADGAMARSTHCLCECCGDASPAGAVGEAAGAVVGGDASTCRGAGASASFGCLAAHDRGGAAAA